MMDLPSADAVHRTALMHAYGEQYATFEEALAAHSATGVVIIADDRTCANATGQAAVCTAIATASRAFGNTLVVADAETLIAAGPYAGSSLAQVAGREGARPADSLGDVPSGWPVVVIGPRPDRLAESIAARAGEVTLYAQWSGWIARVSPAAGARTASVEDRPENILAAIGAAGLAVHEAFGAAQARPGSDAGYRTIILNLWRPGTDQDDGPALSAAPAAWWLVGLGHLGQANAWVLSFLTYAKQSNIEVVLQDDDFAVPANHSTGLFTPPEPDRVRKTRLVASILDRCGFATRITEFRLDPEMRVGARESHVALLGVDNLSTRRLISNVSWDLAIDTGLGAGPSDFNAIMVRRFPGARRSDEVPAWSEKSEESRPVRNRVFDDAAERDECGAATLAGLAVGATFVGVIAACLAVAEAVRPLHGGAGHDVVSVHLGSNDWEHALSETSIDIIPSRLATPS